MGLVKSLPEVEGWLDADADSWSSLSDREYKALASRWSEVFLPLITASVLKHLGRHAIKSIEKWLPADVYLLSGFQVRRLANMGGDGPAGYRASGLRQVSRELANQHELILVSDDFSWSCVFSHEAGVLVDECFVTV